MSVVIVAVCCGELALQHRADRQSQRQQAQTDALLFELIDKLRTIRHASAEHIWLTRYADSLADYQRSRVENTQLSSHVQVVTSGLVAMAGIATLAIGALHVMNATMSAGELVAAMMIVWRILVPIQVAALNIARIKQTLSTVRQVNDLVRMGSERESDVPPTLSRRLGGQIFCFQPLSLIGSAAGAAAARAQPRCEGRRDHRHHRTERKRQINTAQGDPRPLSAIYGHRPVGRTRPAAAPSGRGSSGHRIRVATTGVLLRQHRCELPIRKSRRHRCRHCRCAGRGRCVATHPELPEGLETHISGTDARALSQGWLCRLSIARALVKKPAILLLDDPGNGLDQASDAAFMAHLNAMRGKRTVLWVTARPSHMRLADRVLEMRGGMIVADGKPDVIVPKILARMTRPLESNDRASARLK